MKKILVLGMHRSGTSLVTSLINKMGISNRSDASPNIFNVSGYYEDTELVFKNEEFLRSVDCSWCDTGKIAELFDIEKEIRSFYKEKLLDYDSSGQSYVIKDPRIALFLPIIGDLFDDAKIIYCIRESSAVSKSIRQRDGIEDQEATALKTFYDNEIQKFLNSRDYLVVQYERLINQPADTMRQMSEFLGLQYNQQLEHEIRGGVRLFFAKLRLLPSQIVKDFKRISKNPKKITITSAVRRMKVYIGIFK